MPTFRAFQAFRPRQDLAKKIAALPYDVMSSEEAREMVKGRPYSFLHVDRAETDLPPGTDPYAPEVYEKASENLTWLEKSGALVQDDAPCLYIYRQIMNGRSQTGLVGCASIDDYLENHIKKHEFTREDKEQDRIRHVDACDANTGPIFLTYRRDTEISAAIAAWRKAHSPAYDFTTEDGVRQIIWVVDDPAVIAKLEQAFYALDSMYIADGHHRCASAVKVGLRRREEHPDYTGEEEFNFFLAVAFPDTDPTVLDYNRVVRDLNGLDTEAFLSRVEAYFTVTPWDAPVPCKPTEKHTFGMYLNRRWYLLSAKPCAVDETDPVARLDVSILQDFLLSPILGIDDPRTDPRIDFVGGIRGLEELERRVKNGMALAFSLVATSIEDLMNIADAKRVMPPKSTWFEPKLLSGLFIHPLR